MTAGDNRAVVDTSRMNFEPGSWQEALFEIYVGFKVAFGHIIYFARLLFTEYLYKPLMKALGFNVSEKRRINVPHDMQELKVIGVGYGRTGTYSLTLALEELGYPTLHTQHLYENDEIFEMWANQIFQPSIDSGNAFLGSPDLDLITSHGYQATMDLPMALYFERVMEQYPDCKFILTTRENSEVWFRSWDILTKSIVHPSKVGGFVFTNVNRIFTYLRWLFAIVNKDNSYLTTSYPLPDQQKKAAIDSYEAHNAKVRKTIPAENLLEYNVKQGWEPLCKFLEAENCPTTPFPKSNSARSVQVQAISTIILPLVVFLFIFFYSVTYVFHRVTGKTVLQWVQLKYHYTIEFFAYGSSKAASAASAAYSCPKKSLKAS